MYKYRALVMYSKPVIAKYYGVKTNQLVERHYYCFYRKFFIDKYVGNFR